MDEEEIDEMLNFNPEVETSFNTSNDIPMEDFTIKKKEKIEKQLSSIHRS